MKTEAIVLHSFKYGDTKMIAELLTPDHGRMSCVATLSKSPAAKLRRQCLQPLTIIEALVDVRRNARMQRLKEARVAAPFVSIPFSPIKLPVALFTAEFLRCATRGGQTDEAVYRYALNSILWLDGCDGRVANFHLVFMMRMARFLGFYPNLDGYAAGCLFDLRSSCFTSVAPLHADCLQPDDARKMSLLLRMNYPTMHLFRMTRSERNRMAAVILRYYEIHVPGFPEMKSLPVLRELFDAD